MTFVTSLLDAVRVTDDALFAAEFHREKDKLKCDLKGDKEKIKDLKEADDSFEILKRETKAAIGSCQGVRPGKSARGRLKRL
jgi:hypothetical protein